MSDTLLKIELTRLRRLAPYLTESAEDLEHELFHLELQRDDLNEQIDALEESIRKRKKGDVEREAAEQLEIVVALHRQYRVPLDEEIETAYEKALSAGRVKEPLSVRGEQHA